MTTTRHRSSLGAPHRRVAGSDLACQEDRSWTRPGTGLERAHGRVSSRHLDDRRGYEMTLRARFGNGAIPKPSRHWPAQADLEHTRERASRRGRCNRPPLAGAGPSSAVCIVASSDMPAIRDQQKTFWPAHRRSRGRRVAASTHPRRARAFGRAPEPLACSQRAEGRC